jgi:hypothetical protein
MINKFKPGDLVWCAVNRGSLLRPEGPKRLGLVIELDPRTTHFNIQDTTLWYILVGSREVLFDAKDMEKVND